MKIQLTRNTVVAGKMMGVGDIVETGDDTGRLLVLMGKAVEVFAGVDVGAQSGDTTIVAKLPADDDIEQAVEKLIEMAAPPPTRRTQKAKGGK
jgi:hypothetical protein